MGAPTWHTTYHANKYYSVPAQWFLKNRSFSIGVASAGSGVGGVFWSFVLRAIIDHLGYRWALWISAAGSALINVVAMIFFKTRRKPKDTSQTSIWSGMTLFQNPRFVTLFCASALSVFGQVESISRCFHSNTPQIHGSLFLCPNLRTDSAKCKSLGWIHLVSCHGHRDDLRTHYLRLCGRF